MIRRPPRSTRTDTLFPYTTLFRSGYDSYVSANSQYGALARKLAEELDWNPPVFNGVPTWTFTLATGADGDTRADMEAVGYDQWRWTMSPEIAERAEERSGGKAWDSTCSSWGAAYDSKKKNNE